MDAEIRYLVAEHDVESSRVIASFKNKKNARELEKELSGLEPSLFFGVQEVPHFSKKCRLYKYMAQIDENSGQILPIKNNRHSSDTPYFVILEFGDKNPYYMSYIEKREIIRYRGTPMSYFNGRTPEEAKERAQEYYQKLQSKKETGFEM
jgi:hypothetical protein